jgi:hypothetical protein
MSLFVPKPSDQMSCLIKKRKFKVESLIGYCMCVCPSSGSSFHMDLANFLRLSKLCKISKLKHMFNTEKYNQITKIVNILKEDEFYRSFSDFISKSSSDRRMKYNILHIHHVYIVILRQRTNIIFVLYTNDVMLFSVMLLFSQIVCAQFDFDARENF